MAQRAADGAAIAGLPVPDLQQGLVHDRPARAHQLGEFEIALARHGPDFEHAVGFADVGQLLHPIEVDDVIGLHEAEIEHGHERLAARQQLGVVETGDERNDLRDSAGIVIAEGRWFHRYCIASAASARAARFTWIGNCASIQKNCNFPNLGQPVGDDRPPP